MWGSNQAALSFAIWSTTLGHGPFVRGELHERLALVQGFMSAIAVACLVLSAGMAERARAQQARIALQQHERPAPSV